LKAAPGEGQMSSRRKHSTSVLLKINLDKLDEVLGKYLIPGDLAVLDDRWCASSPAGHSPARRRAEDSCTVGRIANRVPALPRPRSLSESGGTQREYDE